MRPKPWSTSHKTDEAMTQLPLPMQQLMARIGPVWGADIRGHIQMVKDAYAPLLAAANNDGIDVTRNVPYATHARQVLEEFDDAVGEDRHRERKAEAVDGIQLVPRIRQVR